MKSTLNWEMKEFGETKKIKKKDIRDKVENRNKRKEVKKTNGKEFTW